MRKGQSAYCLDVPGEVVVLNKIRLLDWYMDMKRKLTPEEWLREICATWIGTSEHPVIRDTTLSESKQELLMEDRHIGISDAIKIIYQSNTYKRLEDESTKQWHLGPVALYYDLTEETKP